jgi:uroporphyrinogen-III synthase
MPRLDGQRVLVTRPLHQADPLCDLIASAGGHALRYPVLTILPPADNRAIESTLNRLECYQLAIFISPNAANMGLEQMLKRGELPAGLKLATVGKGSALALQKWLGRMPDICPSGRYDSEALLALPELQQVVTQQILIVRGEGGRELLAKTLRQRGAVVEYLEVYRRARPEPSPHWPGTADIITITSSEGLQNLFDMAPPEQRQQLLNTPLVVVSDRSADLARALGFRQAVTIARNASNEALLESVIQLTRA